MVNIFRTGPVGNKCCIMNEMNINVTYVKMKSTTNELANQPGKLIRSRDLSL